MNQKRITAHQKELLMALNDTSLLRHFLRYLYHIRTKNTFTDISYNLSPDQKSFYTKIYIGIWFKSIIWEWTQVIDENEKYSRRWEKKYILKSISELATMIDLGYYDNRRVYNIGEVIWEL